MVTYTVGVSGLNKAAIAEEVVSSAVRVLLLAGLSQDQVVEIFEQAAQQIRSGEAIERDESDDGEDFYMEDGDSHEIWSIANKFEQIAPVKQLNRLGKRANAFNDIADPATLAKAISIASEAAVLRKEALDWLRDEATQAGIEVVPNQEQWTETATDEQLDNEENVIFLDEYRWAGDFNWNLVSQIARRLAETGDREALSSFGEMFMDENLAVETHIRRDVERALGSAGQYEEFLEYVQSHSGSGELAQAEFLDKFIRSSGFSNGTYALESWLEGMARRGELERYKRSNRWRITVG